MPWYMKLYEIKNNVLKVKRKWTEVFFVHDVYLPRGKGEHVANCFISKWTFRHCYLLEYDPTKIIWFCSANLKDVNPAWAFIPNLPKTKILVTYN